MRLLKMFGLAALVAMAAMAFLGAGTASATKTVVCQVNEDPCPGASVKPGGTKIKAINQKEGEKRQQVNLQSNVFLGNGEITCQTSEVEGELKKGANEEQFFLLWQETGVQPEAQYQLEDKITNVTFKECGRIEGGVKVEVCTAEALQLPWQTLLTANNPQDGNGTMEVFEGSTNSGQPGARVKCPGIKLDCIYKVKEEGQAGTPKEGVGKLKVVGGNPAIVIAEQIKLKTELPPKPREGTCLLATQAEWSAHYEITEPAQALWVRHIA